MKNTAALAAASCCFFFLAFAPQRALLVRTLGGDDPPGDEPEPSQEQETPKAKGKAKVKLTVDELYVREHLAEHLHATEVKFFDDGFVKLTFDFVKKDLEQGKSFTPPVTAEVNSPFRWTVPGEETSGITKEGTSVRTRGGLKIASRGLAFLNCWYVDDLTATLNYLPSSSHDPRQFVALLFQNEKKKALGTNFGCQSAIYVNGQPKGEVRGKVPLIAAREPLAIKLIVKDGKFEGQVGKTQKELMDYDPKEFPSGQIGILWGGPNVNGIVKKLEVAGRLDFPRVAKEIRTAPRK